MCHELLSQHALFLLESMQKGHAESAFRDASSGLFIIVRKGSA